MSRWIFKDDSTLPPPPSFKNIPKNYPSGSKTGTELYLDLVQGIVLQEEDLFFVCRSCILQRLLMICFFSINKSEIERRFKISLFYLPIFD
jgi:hypothetical protein